MVILPDLKSPKNSCTNVKLVHTGSCTQ